MADSTEAADRTATDEDGSDRRRAALLALIGEFLRDLNPRRAAAVSIEPTSRLERDLGIDSLGRSELALRIERAFRVRLPAAALTAAETVDDLAKVLLGARPHVPPARLVTFAASLPAVSAAAGARTLPEILHWHADRHPDRLHVTVLEDDETVLGTLTYGELFDEARGVASGLVKGGIDPGDRVALMLPTSREFFVAFAGILCAGAIPVPVYPPARLAQIEDHMRRQAGILRNAGAKMLVTIPEIRRLALLLQGQVSTLVAVVTVSDLADNSVAPPLITAAPSDVALIQYTSGSTGDPKGVVLTHANLVANIRAMGSALQASSEDVFVSWLPLYHDMGLIGAWMGSLYHAAALCVMPPTSFLARPASWLRAIHRYRGTLSAAPNFAFDICAGKIDDADLEGLHLGSLRMVANGSEPVSAETVRRFAGRFAQFGFREEAMAPVYGLAECAVGLAFPPLGRPPLIDRIDRDALSGRGLAESVQADDPKALELVACGQALADHEIRVVDDSGRELADRVEGRLEFRGPSATSGYFQDDDKTRQLIRDGWLDSGDRAYIANGDVYVTGRIKDIVIRGGRNIHPQELEHEIGAIPGVRAGGVVAIGSCDPRSGTELLVVLAETKETDPAARSALETRIMEVSAHVLGVPPDKVVLTAPRTIPKTSSGKLRRSAAKSLYEGGLLDGKILSVRWQIARLALVSMTGRILRTRRRLSQWLYAGWWWTNVGLFYVVGWVAAMILPKLTWRWAAVRRFARIAFAGMGVPVSIRGIERIPRGGGVLVFNHSSYLDVLLISAFVPGEPVFVAKKELADQKFAGPLLRRLGAVFVERYDVGASLADAEAVVRVARDGRLLVFFPEGSFTRRPGLSEFYLGAFKVAAESGQPVIPGLLSGTRAMLRSDQWFPLRTALGMTIEEPITPTGNDFDAVLQLRDAARAVILAGGGEPDIRELVKPVPPAA